MTPLSRHYAKLCDPDDFEDPEFLEAVVDMVPERDPRAHVDRKTWEFAMAAMWLGEVGALREDARALGVGAGDERLIFWLANRVGSVVATDIYGEGAFGDREAVRSMLADPAAHSPFPYREDRLEVRYMDARALELEDGSFDIVFCISSIEHFGGPREIAQAAAEIGRVLRPGGHAAIVSECFVDKDWRDSAPLDFAVRAATLGRRRPVATLRRRGVADEIFTPRELPKRIVEPSGLTLMQPVDFSLSAGAWDNLTVLHPDGRIEPRTGEKLPHVLLQVHHSVFTSVFLPLRKAG